MDFNNDFLIKVEAIRTRKWEKTDLLKSFFSFGISDLMQSFSDAGRFFFVLNHSEICTIYMIRKDEKRKLNSFKIKQKDFEQMVLNNENYEDDVFKYKFLLKSIKRNY